MQSKPLFDSIYSSPTVSPHPHSMHQHHQHNLDSQSYASFCRKSNGRLSANSMRSSCCDTNCTSSSSNASSVSSSHKQPETDEEFHKTSSSLTSQTEGGDSAAALSNINGRATATATVQKRITSCSDSSSSSTNKSRQHQSEAESGFSSISSFQEIGLPLINAAHAAPSTTCSSNASDDSSNAESGDANDRTLEPEKACGDSDLPSLPQRYQHRHWDSAPALPPKKTYHLSTLNGDEALRVLWV